MQTGASGLAFRSCAQLQPGPWVAPLQPCSLGSSAQRCSGSCSSSSRSSCSSGGWSSRSASGCSSSSNSSRGRRRGGSCATAALGPAGYCALFEIAAVSSAGQDLLVGAAALGAVGAALYSGLRREPAPCPLCGGNGGSKCFGCDGSGTMDNLVQPQRRRDGGAGGVLPPKRDVVGRTFNPRACRVCGGSGMTLCSRCKGSGYC